MLTLMASNIFNASIPLNTTYLHAAVFAVLAIVLAEGAPKSAFGWHGAAALACAIASAFGNGVGLVTWPVMAWGALRRRDWSWLGTVLVCGAVFVGLYLRQQHDPGSATTAALKDPGNAVILALSFITLPWTRVAPQVSWIGGAMIAIAAIGIIVLKGGPKGSPIERIACGLMLFSLGSAAMAGLGRADDAYNVPLRYGVLVAPLSLDRAV
jgi:hypothetical protein